MQRLLTTLLLISIYAASLTAQQSVARQWNEVLIEAIRNDLSRPTVHARNLFHISAVMYDAWAVYNDQASTYLLGNTVGDYEFAFNGITIPNDEITVKKAQEEAKTKYLAKQIQLERDREEFKQVANRGNKS